MVASRIAPAVTDYCVFCRSHSHQGLDQALALFRASALLELGMDSTDGTGATLVLATDPQRRGAAHRSCRGRGRGADAACRHGAVHIPVVRAQTPSY